MVSLFIVEFTEIVVLGMGFDHGVDDASKFVCRGFDCQLGAVLCLDSAIVGSQSTLATVEAAGGQAEGVSSAVGSLLGLGLEDFASGDLVVGTEAEPGGEVFAGGPLAHIDTGF